MVAIPSPGLSVLFSTLCIVDLFGVFPVVALPRAIIGCGWLGLPLALCVFTVQVYTAILLGRCWLMAERIDHRIARKSRYPYAALAEMTFGERVSRMVTYLLDLTVFGNSIPNLLVASQTLQMIGLKASDWNFDFSFCYWMLLLGLVLCPFMWLGSPKDMKWVAMTSVGTVLSVSALTWACLLTAEPAAAPRIPAPTWETVCIAYGILAFQFDIHPVVLTVQVDMADRRKLGQAVLGAFTVTGTLSLVTCVITYLQLGDQARYNLLQGLRPSGYLLADQLLVTVQICLSMVVSGAALFQDVEHNLGIPKEFTWRRVAVRSALVLFAVLLGEAVPRFDLVMGLLGAALTGPLMFVLPPVFYARLRAMEPQPDWGDVVAPLGPSPAPSPAPPSPTALGLGGNLRSLLDIHKRVDSFEGLRQPLFADDYGTFSRASGSRYRRELFERPREGLADRLKRAVSLEDYPSIGPLTVWERAWTAALVAFGISATALSTFYTLRGTLQYASFTPPCIVNVTIASRAVIDDAF